MLWRFVMRVLGAGLIVGSLVAVGWFTYNAIELGVFSEGVRWPFLVGAALLQLAGVALLPFLWQRILSALWTGWRTSKVDRVLLLRAYGRSWLARYIPGKIWMFGGRLLLAQRLGVPASVLARSMALEVLFSYGMLALLGASLLLAVFTHPLVGVAVAVAGFITGPYLLKAINPRQAPQGDRSRLTRVLGGLSGLLVGQQPLSFSFARWAFGAYGLRAVLQVASIVLLALSFLDLSVAQATTVAGAWAVSIVAVYLFPLAPAGLGIREGVAMGLLAPVLGVAPAAALVAASRLITVTADVAFVALAEIAALKPRPNGTGTTEGDGRREASLMATDTSGQSPFIQSDINR